MNVCLNENMIERMYVWMSKEKCTFVKLLQSPPLSLGRSCS